MMPIRSIFCDVDGVLADFDGGALELVNSLIDGTLRKWWTRAVDKRVKDAKRTLGNNHVFLSDDLRVPLVRELLYAAVAFEGRTFWSSLKKTPECDEIWRALNDIKDDVSLLTAYVGGKDEAIAGKSEWALIHLSPVPSRVIVARSSKKHEFAMSNDIANFLVDDRPDIIAEWTRSGGIGIVHSDVETTVAEIKAIVLRSNGA